MSDYESVSKSGSNRISSRSIKKNRIKPKSSNLPWEEESLTYSREKGLAIIKLQRENAELRKKLKDLNLRLNIIIENAHQKKPKKKAVEVNPSDSLETAKRKLKYYE